MNEPDLNLLIALDALLAEVSVAGAARRLGLSASAMSRTLTRLRASTGDPLLVRAGRKMVLTPYAETLQERTQHAVFDARALLMPPVNELNLATLARAFTLRANDDFTEIYGAALIAAASAVAPQVFLRFAPKPEKNTAPLREGLIDLEIGVLGDMGPEVRLQALFRDKFVGVVRKEHPLASKKQVTAEEYVAWSHVVTSRRGRIRGPVDDALAEQGLERKIAAVVPGFSAALSVAQASDLVALVPASCLKKHPARVAATLHPFELPVSTEIITISLMWHPRMDADAAHRWLRQLVLSVCKD